LSKFRLLDGIGEIELKYTIEDVDHIRGWRDARTDKPEAANGIIKALRQVYAFAIENDSAKTKPAKDVPYLKPSGVGFHSSTLAVVEQVGLPHCSAHGLLRKAAATRSADLRASEHEIMAITGHQTSKRSRPLH